jgi:hypothetical protein
MAKDSQIPTVGTGSPGNFREFLLTDNVKDKRSYEYGKIVAKYVTFTISDGFAGYFYARNQRYGINRNAAAGKINMIKFMDLMDFNGKQNYLNLNWSCIKIINTIIGRTVGRWMGRNEKIVCTATDSLSVKDKENEYKEAEFMLYEGQKMQQLQQKSGMQLVPQGQFIPQDQDELMLWANQYQRIPEEILFGTGINDVMYSNGFYDVLKEKLLHDSAEVGLVCTYTWMDNDGLIHVDWIKPENFFYSYTEFPDMRDTVWRGNKKIIKITDLRRLYGQANNPNNPNALTEEQIFEIAKTAKEYQVPDKITWLYQWATAMVRPYDEWNVDAIQFELQTLDTESIRVKTTGNGSTIISKDLKGSGEVISKDKLNIYKGVYLVDNNILLEWGLKENMIRPQDPRKLGEAQFSYSCYMYQNFDMRNVAIPEKINAPAEQMILATLKIQQLVAKQRPNGSAINATALRELDLGLADGNKPMDVKKLFDQTGDLYYEGKDAEGNINPIPIVQAPDDGFLQKLQALVQSYEFHYNVLKNELGEDPSLITQAAKPRVTTSNIQTAQTEGANATDYMYDAYLYVMEETANKIGCLLKNSVQYGAQAYRQLMNEQAIKNRVFATKVQMLPTEIELQIFENFMNQAIAANPQLSNFLDQFHALNIAKEDVKLASLYLKQCQKKAVQATQQQAQQNAQVNGQVQQQSIDAKLQADIQLKNAEINAEIKLKEAEGLTQNKTAVVNMVSMIVSKGMAITPEMQPLVNAVFQNIMIPLATDNEFQKQALIQAMQQAQMAQQAKQQQPNDQMQSLPQGQQQPDNTQQNQPPPPQQQAA